MATGITLTHPLLGDESVHAVDEDHAAALAHLGWVPEGTKAPAETIAEIKDRVGDDPDLAAQALALEQASPNPRVTLVEHLSAVVNPSPED
ncbi:MAG TPA: hypothetical protein VHK88_20260 [Aquihabitans sp.]|jgi:hypothetical protein|nr:hypothetical protein [Aquihabitans sp.]